MNGIEGCLGGSTNALASALGSWIVPVPAAFSIDQILDKIGPFLVVFFFFIVPIIRTIRESRAQKRAAKDRGEPVGDPATGDDARKAWDDLMRGDAPTTSAPPVPPPIVTAGRIEPVEPIEPGARTAPLAGRLSDLAPVPTEDEEEATLDEEASARETNERALREEFERRAAFLRKERESAARKTVAPLDMSTLAPQVEEPAPPARVSSSGLAPGSSRADWRRALIAAELLGRPVALREAGDGIGPISLRQ